MTYYLDFDCTLYDTEKLINEIIQKLADALSKENDYSEVFNYLNEEFKINRVPDVFAFCKKCAKKYNADSATLVNIINSILKNGKHFVYEDTISFLRKIKNNKIILLTYSVKESVKYQKLKIKGSGLEEFFDEIIITTDSKGDLNIDYKNGIFIDDSPKAIAEIHTKNPLKIIRLNRENSTYKNLKPPEYINAQEIKTLLDIV